MPRGSRRMQGSSSMNRQKIDAADESKNSHSIGWPHRDRFGNCLCFCGVCIGQSGCRCVSCTHQSHPRLARV